MKTFTIFETTDGKFIGQQIPDLDIGQEYTIGDYVFEVVEKSENESLIVLANSNYIIKGKM